MTYDLIVTNGVVMPMNGGAIIRDGAVAISGNSIAAVAPADEIGTAPAARVIDARGRVIMPGFCNSHTHIASNVLLRGLLEDVRLFEWIQTMWKLKQNFDPETL